MAEQAVPAFMAALIGEGVTPRQIEIAVERVRRLALGDSLSALAGRGEYDPVARAFIFEQAQRLEGGTA